VLPSAVNTSGALLCLAIYTKMLSGKRKRLGKNKEMRRKFSSH
jgi:hypothetical protein